jgi:hypothetical protein
MDLRRAWSPDGHALESNESSLDDQTPPVWMCMCMGKQWSMNLKRRVWSSGMAPRGLLSFNVVSRRSSLCWYQMLTARRVHAAGRSKEITTNAMRCEERKKEWRGKVGKTWYRE